MDPPLPMLDTRWATFHAFNQLSFRESESLPATYGFDWTGSVCGDMWQFHLASCLCSALDDPAARRLLFELNGVPHNDQNQASVLIAMTSIGEEEVYKMA